MLIVAPSKPAHNITARTHAHTQTQEHTQKHTHEQSHTRKPTHTNTHTRTQSPTEMQPVQSDRVWTAHGFPVFVSASSKPFP